MVVIFCQKNARIRTLLSIWQRQRWKNAQALLCSLSCPCSVNEAFELAQAHSQLPELPALVRAAAVGTGYREGGSSVPLLSGGYFHPFLE